VDHLGSYPQVHLPIVFLPKQVEQEALRSIIEVASEDDEEFLASRDKDFRFCMGKSIEAIVDDEEKSRI
jgi:hypothetical protein